jgi:hypothetical protein|tara:strand:+ start:352 stop:573 length:222 start_codon:yes stop_codon:yes gene_type:complete
MPVQVSVAQTATALVSRPDPGRPAPWFEEAEVERVPLADVVSRAVIKRPADQPVQYEAWAERGRIVKWEEVHK